MGLEKIDISPLISSFKTTADPRLGGGISSLIGSTGEAYQSDLDPYTILAPKDPLYELMKGIQTYPTLESMMAATPLSLSPNPIYLESENGANEAAKLRKQIADKEAEIAEQRTYFKKEIEILSKEKKLSENQKTELKEKFEQHQQDLIKLRKEKDLAYLLDRVCETARVKLVGDHKFVELFENTKKCNAFVVSIDIRRSTDLMLRGKTPQLYAAFLNNLCLKLVSAIKDNYGIVDKFTGDGLLAYFPEFFSGPDAGYRALAAAEACHAMFSSSYLAARNCFTAALKDVGLGIGIDFGEVQLLRITNELTVVGASVVYACRLGGAPAGCTYLNHSATEELKKRCSENFTAREVSFNIKHEGEIMCQHASLSHVRYNPSQPHWLSTQEGLNATANAENNAEKK